MSDATRRIEVTHLTQTDPDGSVWIDRDEVLATLRADMSRRVDVDAIRNDIIEGVREADASDDHDVDAEAVGNIAYEVIRAALAASSETRTVTE